MKQKTYQLELIDNSKISVTDSDVFYTTDTDNYLHFRLEFSDFQKLNPTKAIITLINKDDASVINEEMEMLYGGTNKYYMRPEVIAHAGKWVGQIVYTSANDKKYTSAEFSFQVSGHIMDDRDPRLVIIQDFESMKIVLEEMRLSVNEVLESEYERVEAEANRVASESERVESEVLRNKKISDLSGQFQQVIDETTEKDVVSAPEIIAARNGEANLKARLDKDNQEVTAQLAHIKKDIIYTSEYNFTNSTPDGQLLVELIGNTSADILYVNTDIMIDDQLRVDYPKVKKIIGAGGVITFTNKGKSNLPCLQFEYGQNMEFLNLEFQGDCSKALATDTEYENFLVSPLYLLNCENIKILNCVFRDIVSAGAILTRHCKQMLISQNRIFNCWNHIQGDLQGDGIYVAWGDGVQVVGNHIENQFPNIDEFGRIGITFEFEDTRNCICSDNYIYGYDRAIHVELVGGSVLVSNNIAEGCAMAFVGWHNYNHDVLVKNNNFSNKFVPSDYLVQMETGRRGFVNMLSNLTDQVINKNTLFKGNEFKLEVDVPSLEEFLVTKVTGESYIDNRFIDKTRNKRLFLYNPNETEIINNNELVFIGNEVDCYNVQFSNIGKHRINSNCFYTNRFLLNSTPTPTLPVYEREFSHNAIQSMNSTGVETAGKLFVGSISLFMKGNKFVDVQETTSGDGLFPVGLDFSLEPKLKMIIDDNTLISTLSTSVKNLFKGRMDKSVWPTNSNKRISPEGIQYQMSGMDNKSLVVTTPSGNEKIIVVDDDGLLSTEGQRWK